MASVHQFRLVSSLNSISSPNRPLKFQTLPISASLKSSSPNSEEEPPQSEKNNAVKLAFAKARAYKKDVKTSPVPKIIQTPVPESAEIGNRSGGLKEDDKLSEEVEMPPAVKLAFAKAKAYKKDVKTSPVPKIIQTPVPESAELENQSGRLKEDDKLSEEVEMPPAVKLAFQRAKVYKKNKEEALGKFAGSQGSGAGVNDKVIVMGTGNGLPKRKEGKKEEVTVSSTDFMGLNFSDKKGRRRVPAGLVPISDPFPEGNFPEVEILVGDASKFGEVTKPEPVQEDQTDVYKPKVSTWGVFPRPTNISKTFGGGRTLKPGEELETEEVKAAKDARTRQLLVAYKSKMGMTVDPRLELESEKSLRDGDRLMEVGKLREAMPFYTKVMDDLPFQNELHGLAALQWSICQDSLLRSNEARNMYEKLQSHPSVQVSKKARQFAFSFQAMEMMKITGSTTFPVGTGYQSYFNAFVKDETSYPLKEAEVDEGFGLVEALAYIIFLISPVFIVIFIAIRKGI